LIFPFAAMLAKLGWGVAVCGGTVAAASFTAVSAIAVPGSSLLAQYAGAKGQHPDAFELTIHLRRWPGPDTDRASAVGVAREPGAGVAGMADAFTSPLSLFALEQRVLSAALGRASAPAAGFRAGTPVGVLWQVRSWQLRAGWRTCH
jgi:hypothetical protein